MKQSNDYEKMREDRIEEAGLLIEECRHPGEDQFYQFGKALIAQMAIREAMITESIRELRSSVDALTATLESTNKRIKDIPSIVGSELSEIQGELSSMDAAYRFANNVYES